jgi:hypothetical protein
MLETMRLEILVIVLGKQGLFVGEVSHDVRQQLVEFRPAGFESRRRLKRGLEK